MDEEEVASNSFEMSREELYERVWSKPINHLAVSFGVSGSYLARICTTLNVPRPPVGYWQKKAVGKANPRPELPSALPGDQIVWSKDKPLAVRKGLVGRSMTTTSPLPKVKRFGRHPMLLGVEALFPEDAKD